MFNLQDWINPKYLNETRIIALNRSFKNAKPFEYLEIENFFIPQRVIELLKAVSKETFTKKESDLFSFLQSQDFKTSKITIINQFTHFLSSKPFIEYMKLITQLKLIPNKLDIHATVYQDTDFLLCHDDQLDSRRIAMMFYFSSLEKKDGGALTLYDSKKGIPTSVDKRIIPKLNTFAFFKVSLTSFHAVEEVLTKKQRITIGAWLHDK